MTHKSPSVPVCACPATVSSLVLQPSNKPQQFVADFRSSAKSLLSKYVLYDRSFKSCCAEQVCDKPKYTLWLFNIAMENCPLIDGLPLKICDFPWL